MPPQIKFAQAVLLTNAARGHLSRAGGGQSIIRWTCTPPPILRRKLSNLAKLRGAAYAAQAMKGSRSGNVSIVRA